MGLVIGRFGVFNCYEFTDVTEARLRAELAVISKSVASPEFYVEIAKVEDLSVSTLCAYRLGYSFPPRRPRSETPTVTTVATIIPGTKLYKLD